MRVCNRNMPRRKRKGAVSRRQTQILTHLIRQAEPVEAGPRSRMQMYGATEARLATLEKVERE
jgi:hypothetical protein